MIRTVSDPLPDSAYSFWRLGLALVIATISNVGMWAVIVVLPAVQSEFAIARGAASFPYTMAMVGFATGTLALGRLADQRGIVLPLVMAASFSGIGFVASGFAPNLLFFSVFHFLIGLGAGAGFAPLMADTSHWFVKKRGLAVVIVAAGNYLAGTIWPLAMNLTIPPFGWRATYVGIGIIVAASVTPLSFLLRKRPSHRMMENAKAATEAARSDLGMSPRMLQILLTLAGFSCCMAMSMPQVHIVAYCGDLGYGVARGAEMLSLMLFLGIFSRIGSGFLADRIGGTPTLVLGSLMQGLALVLYLYFDGLASLYVISGIFGLFQGGIVPMYAVICREFLPPQEAGQRIGGVITSTIAGMAVGGYASGLIYDWTASYAMAFLNGVAWNAVNLAVVGWLFWQRHRASILPAV